MSSSSKDVKTRSIATLNDTFRTSFVGGNVYITAGLKELGFEFVGHALDAIKLFNEFTPENDPHGEHDFGSLMVEGHTLFWKIDYYDLSMECGSEDPSDPAVTSRVLTIMLAEEY